MGNKNLEILVEITAGMNPAFDQKMFSVGGVLKFIILSVRQYMEIGHENL